MRKTYEEPAVEVTEFEVRDVITDSEPSEEGWGGGRV